MNLIRIILPDLECIIFPSAYINIQLCICQTQQNLIMFIIVLGQHVSILIESSSGSSEIQILTFAK